MLDLHCHILPGVDDGPQALADSLAVARFCVRDGITHVVATPHCHRFLRLLRDDVLPHVSRFNEELARAGVPLTVLPGSEVQVADTAAYRRDYENGVYCHLGDGRRFTLLEFPWQEALYPPDAPDLVRWLRAHGTTPILAHPERYDFFHDDPGRLRALVRAGAWLQVTVDSLLGNHGPLPRTAGAELLRDYPDVVMATDAHNVRRCSGMSAGYTFVRQRFGAGRADDLLDRADRVLQELLNEGSGSPRHGSLPL
jgi:protein-tyrosine phosphatase